LRPHTPSKPSIAYDGSRTIQNTVVEFKENKINIQIKSSCLGSLFFIVEIKEVFQIKYAAMKRYR
jgi:hypothetical protein